MIIQFFPHPNKKTYPHQTRYGAPVWSGPPAPATTPSHGVFYTAFQIAQATMKHIAVEEWVRRDDIVRTLAATIKFSKGSIVYPHNKEAYERLGACRVIGIVDSYRDINETEWPANDAPFIIHVFPLKIGQDPVNATANYFSMFPPTA